MRFFISFLSKNQFSVLSSEKPGPIEMDTHNDANNEYISEQVWKRFVKWYGVSPNHQLDRKHLYFRTRRCSTCAIPSGPVPRAGIRSEGTNGGHRNVQSGVPKGEIPG